jgi:hypothetical protein
LPSQNGPCIITNAFNTTQGRFKATFIANSSLGAWDNGLANATAVPGATTIAAGAATTPQSFYEALMNASPEESFVYINFHTQYSLAHNKGTPFGLARAQLQKVSCSEYNGDDNVSDDDSHEEDDDNDDHSDDSSNKNSKDDDMIKWQNENSLCFASVGMVSSKKTNKMTGLPTPFPPKAGMVTPARDHNEILVIYTPPNN